MHSLFWLMWMLSHNTGHGFWRWLNYFSSLEGAESLLPYGEVKPCTRLPWEERQQSIMSPLHPAVAGFPEPVSVNRHPCTAWGGQVSDENGWSLCSCCGRTCSEQTPCSCVPPGLWAPEHSWLGEQGALVWYLTWPWSSSQPTDICNPSLSADYAEGREKYPCEPRLESIWWNVTHSAWEQPGWIRRSLSGIIHLTAGGSNSKLHMSFSEWIPSSPNREGWWGLDFFWQQKIWISTTSYSRLAVFEDVCADKYCLKHL